jgi:peptidoglycan LD-endopeptidase LytH
MCDCSPSSSPPRPGLNRRSLLGAVVAGAGVLALGDLWAPGGATAATGSGTLDEPGTAMKTAERMNRQHKDFPAPPAGKVIFPLEPSSKVYVGNNFGACRDGGTRAHAGVDIMAPEHELVYAVVDGAITSRFVDSGGVGSGWGWSLRDPSTDTTYRYFHMLEDSLGLQVGSAVKRGDVIGFVGSSGNTTETNFHLHFEVRPKNVAVDPFPMLLIPDGVARASTPDNGCLGKPMT